nr:hypothetical protein CFP56_76827 [Quercus suber]
MSASASSAPSSDDPATRIITVYRFFGSPKIAVVDENHFSDLQAAEFRKCYGIFFPIAERASNIFVVFKRRPKDL